MSYDCSVSLYVTCIYAIERTCIWPSLIVPSSQHTYPLNKVSGPICALSPAHMPSSKKKRNYNNNLLLMSYD